MVVDQLVKQLDSERERFMCCVTVSSSRARRCRLRFFEPANKLNPDAVARFGLNELTVTRQVQCHPGKGDTVDLLFALNGVPVATCELKNPMTGQTWKNAIRQYKETRDPQCSFVPVLQACSGAFRG